MTDSGKYPILSGRHAGILFPLFSMRSQKDWGIGDFSCIAPWCRWMSGLGLDILQFLPLNEMPPGVICPYTALSAFALDPVHICVPEVEEVENCNELAARLKAREFKKYLSAWKKNPSVQ
ncbi:MAG: 4-alpha-glucanotransferase, partial [bacterium]